jgi:hypothetical protein
VGRFLVNSTDGSGAERTEVVTGRRPNDDVFSVLADAREEHPDRTINWTAAAQEQQS